MVLIPSQDGEAEIGGTGSLNRPRYLDSLNTLDSSSELIRMLSANPVVRVEKRKKLHCQPLLVCREVCNGEIGVEPREP